MRVTKHKFIMINRLRQCIHNFTIPHRPAARWWWRLRVCDVAIRPRRSRILRCFSIGVPSPLHWQILLRRLAIYRVQSATSTRFEIHLTIWLRRVRGKRNLAGLGAPPACTIISFLCFMTNFFTFMPKKGNSNEYADAAVDHRKGGNL